MVSTFNHIMKLSHDKGVGWTWNNKNNLEAAIQSPLRTRLSLKVYE